ncbi:MAG: sulfatase [Bacteroidaceae bacterium]
MNTNSFALAGIALAMTSCQYKPTQITKNEKVNILWLFGEDISPWMPAFGDSTIATPNIDFLARNGVTFTQCYSMCPVSSTTRSGLVTGAMPTTIGAHNHRSGRTKMDPYKLPSYVRILPQLFRKEGYFTYNYGKDDFNWQYNWNDYWAGDHEESWYHQSGKPISWRDRKDKNQPFFGEIELLGGKNNAKTMHPVDPTTIKVPPYYPNTPFMQKVLAQHYNQIIKTDAEIEEILNELKKDKEVYENTIIVFFSDNGYRTMRDKQFLYDGGIHMPLIFSCPGNPDLLKQKGIRKDLVSLLDLTATTLGLANIKIPAYYESKDLFDPEYHRDFIVATRDRCDFTIDRIRAIRTKEFKYIRNFMTDRPLMQPQYRDGKKGYNYILKIKAEGKIKFADDWLSKTKRPAEELYDLKKDPWEIHNLADDLTYNKQLVTMRNTLNKWIKDTDDKGQYPESEGSLKATYVHWGERCSNPEYDKFKKNTPNK